MHSIVLVVHNVRSAHNVGSLLRTADGLGISRVYLTGYTPYPLSKDDIRLPHIATRVDHQIQKTALGAEKNVGWVHRQDIGSLIGILKNQEYKVVALEQTKNATDLKGFMPASDLALVVGSEVGGLDKSVLNMCDRHLQIPMSGQKESFNVAVAAAIALYHLKYNF